MLLRICEKRKGDPAPAKGARGRLRCQQQAGSSRCQAARKQRHCQTGSKQAAQPACCGHVTEQWRTPTQHQRVLGSSKPALNAAASKKRCPTGVEAAEGKKPHTETTWQGGRSRGAGGAKKRATKTTWQDGGWPLGELGGACPPPLVRIHSCMRWEVGSRLSLDSYGRPSG